MKRGALFILSIIIISCISSSCTTSKSTQELLQEEQKAIDKFISMNNISVLDKYPSSGVFKEKEFFRTNEGLFFHVVDSGNGKRVQLVNDVSVRFDYMQYIKSYTSGDTSKISPNLLQPYSFVFGITATYMPQNSLFVCQGWVIPLTYVGEDAVLDLIIPSSIGQANDYNNIDPVFYKNLRYTRFN